MKKILILTIMLVCATWSARAYDWTYSTNLFWSLGYPTNIFCGTNSSDPARDSYIVAWNKLNAFMNLWSRRQAAQDSTNAMLFTNSAAGITNVVFTNTTTLAAGSAATVTNVGVINGIAYFSVGIPRGADGTNTVNVTNIVYAMSNQVLSSKQILAFGTNFAFWKGSNYIARVSGVVDWTISGGDDGGAFSAGVPSSIPVLIKGSYNGSNSWFTLTNGFVTASNITLVVVTNGFSTFGGGLVNPGLLYVYSMDHWELYHRTNDLDYQYFRKADAPTRRDDVVNKGYVDDLYTGSFNQNFTTGFDTNNYQITRYLFQNKPLLELAGRVVLTNIVSCVASGFQTDPITGVTYPTNILLTINTNLPANWVLQSQTNLTLTFYNYTNYILTTNAGFLNLSIAIAPAPQGFFRLVVGQSDWVAIHSTLSIDGGTIYPSNTWSLSDITNRMAAFGSGKHYWTGSSNGLALVTLSYSNGVVRWIRADY